jgi:hypothetical protein
VCVCVLGVCVYICIHIYIHLRPLYQGRDFQQDAAREAEVQKMPQVPLRTL